MHSKQELEYLRDLMADFSVENQPTPEEAYSILITRYSELEKNILPLIKRLEELFNIDPINDLIEALPLPIKSVDLLTYWKFLCLMLHQYLFNGILSNAGSYRNSNEPNNGIVGFGGMHHREVKNFRFTGTPPHLIDNELSAAFGFLEKAGDPVANALEFYRRFVRIHPFYDANGRIARFIVTMYLAVNNKYVRWSSLDAESNKRKFIKRLNNCHTRQGSSETYNEHFKHLYIFFGQFVTNSIDLVRTE